MDPTSTTLSEGQEAPPAKKARCLSTWDSYLMNCNGSNFEMMGLAELFGGKRGSDSRLGGDFFTLRMEHREGGAVARHRGEERILLFRSDRAGAIAKIIFSSEARQSFTQQGHVPHKSDKESELELMSQAKIHVLDVKEEYRGHDLGGLLFSEAVSALRHRYSGADSTCDIDQSSDPHSSQLCASVRCQLEAEEDTRRHNKLVGFYERLGCRVKPKAKVRYLYNDGETYRKVPMEISLHCRGEGRPQKVPGLSQGSLVGRRGGFLPVNLKEAGGSRLGLPPGSHRSKEVDRRIDWLLLDDGEGHIQFRTTQGHCLLAGPDGSAVVSVADDEGEPAESPLRPSPDWSNFHLYRVPDSDDPSSDALGINDEVRQKELWMLQSSHGTFLKADTVSHTLSCSKAPTFWQASKEDLCLTCTDDTPPRRQHYRKMWTRQTVQYVMAMREKYFGFNLKRMGMREALDIVKNIPCHPFRVDRGGSRTGTVPSLRTLSFRAAEAARNEGHPDWVQFVALVHELGGAVNRIETAASRSADDFDWTITSRSRVVGCAAPERASFGEFRRVNADESDDRYNSPQGMYKLHCGLSNVLLAWTGPEYMYHMLQHNCVNLPDEGLAMLRLFSLGDWHTFMGYDGLTDTDDEAVRPFVAEFDDLRRGARRECADIEEMTDGECDRLWNAHYAKVVSKYGCNEKLRW